MAGKKQKRKESINIQISESGTTRTAWGAPSQATAWFGSLYMSSFWVRQLPEIGFLMVLAKT